MWRWLSGLPRAIRQQIHGPRATSGVCLEEEAELEQQCKDVQRKKFFLFEKKNVISASSNSKFDGEDQSKHGPDQDKWYKNCSSDFCSYFQGTHALEALGWGAAVVLGIHLSKCPVQQREKHRRKSQLEQQKRCLLYQVALTVPDKAKNSNRSLGHSIVDSNIERNSPLVQSIVNTSAGSNRTVEQSTTGKEKGINTPLVDTIVTRHKFEKIDFKLDAEKQDSKVKQFEKDEQESQDPLYKAMNQFEEMCKKYTGIARNIQGLQTMAKGQVKKAVSSFIDASHLGYTKAQYNLGLCYETGKGVKVNLKKAEKFYRIAAEDGHALAMYNLALMYLKGEGEIEKNIPLSLELLHRAAENGLGQAQTYLGVYYTEEESQDLEKAVSFFKAAAAQNDSEAQYFLGVCYEQGWGVEVNQCKSADLYSQAASGGHDGAMYNLGVFHELALGGLPEDRVSALEMYQKAADAGHEQAQFQLTRLKADMVREDLKLVHLVDEEKLVPKHVKEKEDPEPDEQSLKLSVSLSSPSLTDYVRNHLCSFTPSSAITITDTLSLLKSQLFSVYPLVGIINNGSNGEITPNKGLSFLDKEMADWNPLYGSPRRSPSSSQRVSFSLGADDEDLEGLTSLAEDDSIDSLIMTSDQTSSFTRNSTMPNLYYISCN